MIQIDNFRYNAEEGNFILRKSDDYIMGESICLGDADTIDNYKEEPYTEESYKEFYASVGIDIDARNAERRGMPGQEEEETEQEETEAEEEEPVNE